MSKKPAVVKSELNLPQCESGSARYARSTTAYGPLSEFRGGRPCFNLFMLHWNWNCITKSFKRNLETLLRLELVKVYRFLLSLASVARPSSSRNAVSSFSSLESLSWGGMKAGHNSTWDNPEKGKKRWKDPKATKERESLEYTLYWLRSRENCIFR